MSWGIKITVLYLGFVALILSLVFTCFRHKTELESADYYAKELRFQDQIDAAANEDALNESLDYSVVNRSVQLLLPKEVLSSELQGTVHFLRPSDASQDKQIVLSPGSDGKQVIEAGFIKGVYKMQISFESHGKNYYKEAVINFK